MDTRGEESTRVGILAVAILTRNASRKDARRETGQMDIVVLALRLLINGVGPGFLMINPVGDARRMRCGVVGRSLGYFFYLTGHISLPTYVAA